MEPIFDRIVSSSLIMILFCCGLLTAGIFIGLLTNPFKNKKKLQVPYLMAIILISCFPIFFLTGGKLGLVNEIVKIMKVDDKIIFVDLRVTSDEYGTYNKNRIYVIDSKTGERLDRSLLGYETVFLNEKNGLFFFKSEKKYVLYNVKNLAIEREIDDDYLMATFPELSVGIESISESQNCLTILAKNGKSYIYDAFENKINVPCLPENIPLTQKYSYYYDKIYINENGQQVELFTFNSKNPNDLLKHIESVPHAENQTKIVSQEGFISGEYIGIFENQNIFLVKSYETTDKTDFIITALNFNLEILWKLDFATLEPDDFYSKNTSLTLDIIEDKENIIFGIGGFLYCIEAKTGNIVWKKRF